MKKTILMGAVLGIAGVLSAGAMAGYLAWKNPGFAEVVSVDPVRQAVTTLEKVCRHEMVTRRKPAKDEHRILGTVIGGMAGGVVGHQFGNGTGNTVATIAGAAAGGYAGNQVQKKCRKRIPVPLSRNIAGRQTGCRKKWLPTMFVIASMARPRKCAWITIPVRACRSGTVGWC